MRINKKKNEVMKKVLLFLAMVTVSVATWAQEKTTESTTDEYGIYAGSGEDLINYNELKDSREVHYWFEPEDRTEEVILYYDFGAVVSIKYIPKDQIYNDFQKRLLSIKEEGETINIETEAQSQK